MNLKSAIILIPLILTTTASTYSLPNSAVRAREFHEMLEEPKITKPKFTSGIGSDINRYMGDYENVRRLGKAGWFRVYNKIGR